jgi:excisionase family DNA binding protein
MKYTTMTGHELEIDDGRRDVLAFLARLTRMLEDPKARENDLIALGYSNENPFLDHAIFPGRGAVTPRVFEDHAYHVLVDLIARKRLAQDGVDISRLAEEYTITVPEAAKLLGIHESAVRQAIARHRLGSWMKDGRHYLHPRSIESYRISARGPVAEGGGEPLDICMGHRAGETMKARYPGTLQDERRIEGNIVAGRVMRWKRAAVLTGAGASARMFVLEPADETSEVKFGPFYVRGKFRVAQKINNAQKARETWRTFEAA